MSGCSYHASRESVGACVNCGKLVCATCHNEVEGKSYCPVCVDKLFAVKEAETKPVSVKQETSVPVAAIKESPPEPKEAVSILSAKTEVVAPPAAKTVVAVPAKPPEGPAGVNPLWWVAVVIGGWVGGLLAWLLNKDKQPKTSKYMLFGGIGWSALQAFVAVILVFSLIIAPAIGTHLQAVKPVAPNTGATAPSTAGKTNPLAESSATMAEVNGGPSEETIEIKTPAPITPPVPTYKTSPLLSQDLQPSDQDQTVKYADNLTVIVPGGGLKQADKLTISSVSDVPEWNYLHRDDIAIYDISFSSQHEFEKPLTFEVAYDPSQIPGDVTPGQVMGASYLADDGKTWVDVPVSVDVKRHKIIESTQHNGIRRYWDNPVAASVLYYDIFEIRYWPQDFQVTWTTQDQDKLDALVKKGYAGNLTVNERTLGKELARRKAAFTRAALKSGSTLGQFDGCPDSGADYKKYPGVPKYVVDVGWYLTKAVAAYQTELGKNLDPGKVWRSDNPEVEVHTFSDTNSRQEQQYILVIIDPSDENSFQNGYLGYIGINGNTRCASDNVHTALGIAIAHEVFHAVQCLDYTSFIRQAGPILGFFWGETTWWFESTADYASNMIVGKMGVPCNVPIGESYLSLDFFSNGDAANKTENHPYLNSYFFDYLVKRQGIDFVEMYKRVAEDRSAITNGDLTTRAVLDRYLRENSQPKLGLYGLYHEWVKYLYFDKEGFNSPLRTGERPLYMTNQYTKWSLGPGMVADYYGMRPEVDPATGVRSLSVNFKDFGISGNALPEYFWVDVFLLKNNELKAENVKLLGTWDISKDTYPQEICKVDVNPNDAVYIVATMYACDKQPFSIDITDAAKLEVKGPDYPSLVLGKGTIGQPYSFRAVPTGVPSTAKYTWYVDGKAVNDSGSVLSNYRFWSAGEHSVSAKAAWDPSGSVESNEYTFTIGTPILIVKSPVSPGEEAFSGIPYTFTLVREYIPLGAEYYWYIDDKAIDGDEEGTKYTFEKGEFHVRVMAEWPMARGNPGRANDSLPFQVAEGFKISANPVPGIVAQPSSFNITGAGIPANSSFTWDFGKNESGALTTQGPDVMAPHTYQKAGTYAVTATAIDVGSGKTLGKTTLQYEVIAQPYVKIDPRPSSAKVGDKINLTAKLYNMPDKPEDLMQAPLYEWTISKDDTPEAWPKGEDFSYTINGPGQWTVSLRVTAKDKNGRWIKGKDGENQLTDSITISAGALSLNIPAELKAGKGVTNKTYNLSVTTQNIPAGAEYVWYSNGDEKQRAVDKTSVSASYSKANDYTLKVEANWTDSRGNQQSLSSKEVSFSIKDTDESTDALPQTDTTLIDVPLYGPHCSKNSDTAPNTYMVIARFYQNGKLVSTSKEFKYPNDCNCREAEVPRGHYTVVVTYQLYLGHYTNDLQIQPVKTYTKEIDVGAVGPVIHYGQ